MIFFKVVVDKPLPPLDYLPPKEDPLGLLRIPVQMEAYAHLIGARVIVPVQKKKYTGIVIEVHQKADCSIEKIRHIEEWIDSSSLLPPAYLDFLTKMARYYHYPLGQSFFSVLPSFFKKNHPLPASAPLSTALKAPHALPFPLNAAQEKAFLRVCAEEGHFKVFVLEGVTGSGKTAVYCALAQYFLKKNKQVLILVPEIALTPQTFASFEQACGSSVFCYHSKISSKKRYHCFAQALAGEPMVVVGTRSALFLPLTQLALCIVDEEHDQSYKQDHGLRYHARDMAIWRSALGSMPIVLGSATPSLESYAPLCSNPPNPSWEKLSLPQRANLGEAPDLILIDRRGLAKRSFEERERLLISPQTQGLMKAFLERGEQVLLFINRRGFAPLWMCKSCTEPSLCPACQVRLFYHHHPERLLCHHCSYNCPLPITCPHCGEGMIAIGSGTQRIESFAQSLFPDIPIIRLDSDSTQKAGVLEKAFKQAHSLGPRIFIGTQLLAKGHHFPFLTLVVLLEIDNTLYNSDYRATEQVVQLVTQVRGRAGRADKPGQVLLETMFPEHPLWKDIAHSAYADIAQQLLQQRAEYQMPPCSALALIRVESRSPTKGLEALLALKNLCKGPLFSRHSKVALLGPVMAPMPMKNHFHRAQLLIRAPDKKTRALFLNTLDPFLKKAGKGLSLSLDIDPISLL